MTPQALHHPSKAAKAYMKGRSDVPLILGRLRPSKPLTSTQVLSQCAAMHGGTEAAYQFLQAPMDGSLIQHLFLQFCLNLNLRFKNS